MPKLVYSGSNQSFTQSFVQPYIPEVRQERNEVYTTDRFIDGAPFGRVKPEKKKNKVK